MLSAGLHPWQHRQHYGVPLTLCFAIVSCLQPKTARPAGAAPSSDIGQATALQHQATASGTPKHPPPQAVKAYTVGMLSCGQHAVLTGLSRTALQTSDCLR